MSNLPVWHIVSGSRGSDVYMVMLGAEASAALASNLDKTGVALHVTAYMQLKQRRETVWQALCTAVQPTISKVRGAFPIGATLSAWATGSKLPALAPETLTSCQ
eukprot:TRINITY_DN528_c0_g1_i1.p2 TRINITY_DN528_c0_g1~~TRINITY_DN528_c0_g1_i1.p2  ORF type:complete len:104 (-),score=20.05 TRINITY_DN528_c0_g1_i1:189-500(-)